MRPPAPVDLCSSNGPDNRRSGIGLRPSRCCSGRSPLAESASFTVLVYGGARLQIASGGGEIEGSLAGGGNISFGTYNLLANTDGSTLATTQGEQIQLLVGSTMLAGPGAAKLDLNTGNGLLENVDGALTPLDSSETPSADDFSHRSLYGTSTAGTGLP